MYTIVNNNYINKNTSYLFIYLTYLNLTEMLTAHAFLSTQKLIRRSILR